MTIKPIRDWLLIEPDKETQTASGIQLPEAYKEPGGTASGVVVGIGPGIVGNDWSMAANIGERVLFLRKHGIPTKLAGKNYLMVRDEQLLAVIE